MESDEPTTTITITAACETSTSGWSTTWGPGPPANPSWAEASPTAMASSTDNPLTNEQQVGRSVLGSLRQPRLPKWLPKPDGEQYGTAPWGYRTVHNSDAAIKDNVPHTKVTRKYHWTVTRSTLSPDGVLSNVILINDQFPGPAIEANWGDWVEVVVHNNITDPPEGTSVHWHGMLQRGTQWEDGTSGVSQCPIAPGHKRTYRFRADVFGSSFYHAHYSAQYTAGVIGPMVVHGPASAEYDVDVGVVMLSDWVRAFSNLSGVMRCANEVAESHSIL